jgi:hypothetical protein
MFFRVAERHLSPYGINLGPPTNCRPRLIVSPLDQDTARAPLEGHPTPWTFVCPRSIYYNTRWVADGVWEEACRDLPGTVFWLGNHSPAPPGLVDLHMKRALQVMRVLPHADLLVTVDTGPMHMAAAVGVPCLVIEQSSLPRFHLNDQNDYDVVTQDLNCLHCMKLRCPKSSSRPPCQYPVPERIAAAIRRRLGGVGKVSVVIPTYKAPSGRMNRCLQAILPQVDEVITTRDANGVVAADLLKDPKLRHVQSDRGKLGFGRNVNFGVRHARGEFVLVLNDDCYLKADAVAAMVREMKDESVGIVGHFLRYPNGQICHGGKFRSPGMRGWGLTDNRAYHPTIKEPCEVENVTGTSIMLRRKAFYDAGGFDEDFFLYCEDDALCMQMRQRGWRVMYTPYAEGVHDEAATSSALAKSGNIIPWVNESCDMFWRKWGWWLKENANTIPGHF